MATIADDRESHILDVGEKQDSFINEYCESDDISSDLKTQLKDTITFSPIKHALVIGIGKYQDVSWCEIHGNRDVPIVKQMLNNCGFANIYTLTNTEATKAKILSMLSELGNQCNTGDIVYIHFSGHGQQITDVDGDEDDGWDEAWIPYDAQMAYSESYKGENHLTDDEIGQWLSRIKSRIGDEGKLLVVVDACHSGDSSRDEAGDEVCIRGAKDDFVIPLKVTPKRISKLKEDWLSLTACKDFQVNCEVRTANGNYYGMLSYALCHMAEDMGGIDNKKIMMQLQKFVNKQRSKLPQDVTLTGETDKYSLIDFFK